MFSHEYWVRYPRFLLSFLNEDGNVKREKDKENKNENQAQKRYEVEYCMAFLTTQRGL